MSKVIEAEFIKIPEPDKNDIEKTTQEEFNEIFRNMLGHKYKIYKSESKDEEYVILCGATKEAEKQYEESIFKSLISLGEDEEWARKVSRGEEDPDGCMYFSKHCFDIEE